MSEPKTLTLTCECGATSASLHGLSPARTSRVRCCCQGCQSYARRLGREDLLDAHGGTDVVQLSPERLVFTRGLEHVRALHQTRKGALRWYASCCRTPLANTLKSPKSAFVGVYTAALATGGGDPEAVVGPIRVTVNARLSDADKKRLKGRGRDLLRMLLAFLPKYLWWTLRRDYRRSPFFDAERRTWRREPERLYAPERPEERGLRQTSGCR